MKILHQPVKPFIVNQGFGEDRACITPDNRVFTKVGETCPVGSKSLYGEKGHTGVDLKAYHGQECYAAQRGHVYKIDTNPKSGLDVRIESFEGGKRIRHIYEHLLGYQVKVGDYVRTGQLVGWCDNTGYSSGDHLHWGVEELINGKWTPIDPLPLTSDLFARDVLFLVDKLQWIKEKIAYLLDNAAYKLR